MGIDFKGFNIPEKITIVRKAITEGWGSNEKPTGEYQGYVVTNLKGTSLSTALSWAGCESKWDNETLKDTWPGKENYIFEYDNGQFDLELYSSADNSYNSGKLSFWNCKITAPDGQKFYIGINADLLCDLLLYNDFIKGKCQSKVYLGRQGTNRVGAFTENMPAFEQEKRDQEIKAMKADTKYEVGQMVYDKKNRYVYLGEIYKLFDVGEINDYKPFMSNELLIDAKLKVYKKPIKVYAYAEFSQTLKKDGLKEYAIYDMTKLSDVRLSETKWKMYHDTDKLFEIKSSLKMYKNSLINNYNNWYESWGKDYEKSDTEYDQSWYNNRNSEFHFKLIQYSDKQEKFEYTDDADKIIKNYVKSGRDWYLAEKWKDAKVNNINIVEVE